ncbi:MAG: hypothetical protein HZA59_11435 [Hydrogenophilales bacterium]|nr:hypothetical protein [Hydrogenophilales bacterium]
MDEAAYSVLDHSGNGQVGASAGITERSVGMKENMARLGLFLSVLLLAGLGWVSSGHAATITSTATGNWSAGATWVGGVAPGAGDAVIIANGHTVTVNAAAACTSLTINSGNANSGVTISGANSLTVSGSATVTSNTNNITKTIAVNAGALSIGGNLTLNGANTNRISQLTISTGTATVTGNITADQANERVTFTGSGNLYIGGNFTSGGTLTSSTGTVTFNGAGAQSIGAYLTVGATNNYNNLVIAKTGGTATLLGNILIRGNLTDNGNFTPATGNRTVTFNGTAAQTLNGSAANTTFYRVTLNNANGLTIGHNATVNNLLTLSNGRVTTGANTVILPSGATLAGAAATRFINGRLQKYVATGLNRTVLFEIGSGTTYAPVTTVFASVTTAGSVIASTTAGDHPNLGTSLIDATKSVNRYWTLTNSGVVFTTYNATFNFVAADRDGGAVTSSFVVQRYAAASWFSTVTASPLATSTIAQLLTSFGDFAIGTPSITVQIFVQNYANVCGSDPASVTLVIKDQAGTTVQNFTGTLYLSTSTNLGDWSINTAAGVLDNGTANDGVASYQFAAADQGVAAFNLAVTTASTLTVRVLNTVSAAIVFQTGANAFVITNDPIQVAGRPQAMSARKLNAACATDTTYNGNKNMRIWVTRAAADPGGAAPRIGAVNLPNALPGANNVTLTFASGISSFNLTTTDIGKYELNMREGATTRYGTSDPITTRPFGLAFPGIQHASTATDAVLAKAGANFSGTVSAYLWAGADDANNDGVPDANVNITNNGVTSRYAWATVVSAIAPFQPAAGTLGTLNNGTIARTSFAAGSATATSLQYSEVGTVTLQALAANFLDSPGVNASGTSAMDGAATGMVGRFYPDHFALTAPSITNRSDLACGSTFTYMGEPMSVAFTLTAQNTANTTTQNYIGSFAKLDGATLSKWTAFGSNDSIGLWAMGSNIGGNPLCKAIFSPTTPFTTTLTCPPPATVAAAAARVAVSGTPAGTWLAGVGTFSGNAALNRANTADGPYETLEIGVAPRDADGVQLLGGVLDLDADNSGSAERKNIGNTKLRYGRLRLNNAHGSELLALPVPVKAQYFNSFGFVTHADDNCTGFTLATDLSLGNYQLNLAAGETTPGPASITLSSGASAISLTAPGAGNSGSVDLTLNVPAWLEYNWTGVVGDPTARATFGAYRKSDQFIFQRENY